MVCAIERIQEPEAPNGVDLWEVLRPSVEGVAETLATASRPAPATRMARCTIGEPSSLDQTGAVHCWCRKPSKAGLKDQPSRPVPFLSVQSAGPRSVLKSPVHSNLVSKAFARDAPVIGL